MAAAQDYNTLSNPSVGVDPMAIGLVVKKDQKKQQKELAHLATVLKSVEVELASAKSGATLGSSSVGAADGAKQPLGSTGPAPSSDSLKKVLGEMAGALQMLQVEIAKYAQGKAASEHSISKAELAIAQDNLKKAQDAVEKLAKQQEKQKHLSFWEKLGQAIVGAVLTIVAAITCQPELLIAACLCFAGATGLLAKASQGVADILEALGCPKSVANILAGVIITILVIALTAGAASIAGVDAGAASAADAAAEAAEVGGAVAEDVEQAQSFFTRAASVLRKLNFFRNFSARANLMIMAGTQSATQTGAITNIAGGLAYAIAEAVGDKKDAEKIKEEAEKIASIIVAVMSTLVTAGSGAASAESAMSAAAEAGGTAARLGEDASRLSRMATSVRNFLMSSSFQKLFLGINYISNAAVAGTGTAAGAYQIAQGVVNAELAGYNGDNEVNSSSIEMSKNEMHSSQAFIAQREKQFKTSAQTITKLSSGEAAIAEALCSSAV